VETVCDALSWRHILEPAEEKRVSSRTVICPAEAEAEGKNSRESGQILVQDCGMGTEEYSEAEHRGMITSGGG
jgi:hypothetical protein